VGRKKNGYEVYTEKPNKGDQRGSEHSIKSKKKKKNKSGKKGVWTHQISQKKVSRRWLGESGKKNGKAMHTVNWDLKGPQTYTQKETGNLRLFPLGVRRHWEPVSKGEARDVGGRRNQISGVFRKYLER